MTGLRTNLSALEAKRREIDRQLLAGSDGWAVLPQSCRWHPGLEHEWQLTGARANSPCRPTRDVQKALNFHR